ncbi:MAG: CDF family Co(II)/Ni(II) efflux transporter DmeF [Zoogloeaceae bacterium]|jgi:cation diffusion facilitator family transporter|nr:CDF family Co(II)/Ni(II) efflux transporter DmeF [Zoogloeaceae bacterium]
MSSHDLSLWQHTHHFLDSRDAARQRRTEWVVGITFVTMLAEIAFGYHTGSMALLADGWHMGSHVTALGLAVFAYRYARRQSNNTRFTFGTGKVSALGGYTSALFLALVAALMVWESLQRLWQPVTVAYNEALMVTIVGLLVNLVSIWLLRDGAHEHSHEHTHDHAEKHAHGKNEDGQDHNLQGAFMHVLADLLTSVLAIIALMGGQYLGWTTLDPFIGLIGAGIILYWAKGLVASASRALLDAEDHSETRHAIIAAIESRPDHKVVDLHVWRLGSATKGCIISILTHNPEPLATYKRLIAAIPGIGHMTVEVDCCDCETPL